MPYPEHEEMNRRQFSMNVTAGMLAAAMDTRLSSPHRMQPTRTEPADKNLRFKLSVMLWTVFRDLPFEQRLEKVAEAGYQNVELVGEYAKWSDDDFNRANAKRKELGIRFDATAGLKHGVGNP